MNHHATPSRLLTLFLLTAPLTSWAATPASGTLSDTAPNASYAAGPFTVANPTPVPLVDLGPHCDNLTSPCDSYSLTLTLPSGYAAAHPNASVRVTAGWTDAGSGKSDYDLYVYKGAVDTLDGSRAAEYSSASGNNPEMASIGPLLDGTHTYTVKLVPYTPSGETLNVTLALQPGPSGGTGGGGTGLPFGSADPALPGVPRYQNFYAPHGTSAEPGSGEFNIGFNPRTHRIMTMNAGPVWRLTPPEVASPPRAESCEATWEDKSSTVTDTGLDPILWTDQVSGRTFASNSTVGANALYAFSDDDGDTWVPFGAGAPNGGADHQTIGTGPFPAALSALATPLNQGQNALYCSQDIVGPAFCQRSLDLGVTWGPGVPAYTGSGPLGCGGLHGHVRIAPDGTAWLPVKDCGGGLQGGAVSTDAGTTWSEFVVTGSRSQTPHGGDPSIALDADSTAYYCYVNNEPVPDGSPAEGHVHVKVSRDGGKTWINDVDIGASHGIVNAAQPEAIGGSAGRAACGFIGTDKPGDYEGLDFPGVWYAFIATTYDGGQTWVTVNATPNDPVQARTGVWQGGGGNQNRNLLDFNEITLDDRGRVLYGYSDGCVSEGCIAGTAPNDFVAHMRVARQSGGKPLLAAFDAAEPTPPRQACLSGSRDPAGAHLVWRAPDSGGADISAYQVFRSTAPGETPVLVGQVPGTATAFDDTAANPAVGDYYYTLKAVNAAGTGANSSEFKASMPTAPAESVCSVPGLTQLTDPAGDATPAVPGADLLSFQLAQPYAQDGVVKLVFTLNTDNGQSPQAAGSAWYVAMKIPTTDPANPFVYRAVHMAWNGASPTFESYTPSANNSGGVDGRFVTSGSEKPAEPESHYDAPYNQAVIVVKASDLGLQPGEVIGGFLAGVSQTAAGIATTLIDQMPDGLAYTGTFAVQGNQTCAPVVDAIFRNGFE